MPYVRKAVFGIVGVIGAGGAGLIYSLEKTINASGLGLHPPKWPWSHRGAFHSLDHMSIRRGYEVYKNVCSACHGLRFLPYRKLIGICMTEEEARREAGEVMYQDGPNDDGEMFMRPGKLSDYFKDPYHNKVEAKLANSGAVPPDLSQMALARKGEEDYVFSLMTGYCDAPAGFEVPEGLHYNPYFTGSTTAMAPPLYNEVLEFSDGTPATQSQCAKDVSTFLLWVSSPEFDYRQRLWLKLVIVLAFFSASTHYLKRVKWNTLKFKQLVYREVPPKPKRDFK